MIGFLATPDLRIVGLYLVPLAGFLLSRRFLNLALDDLPHWWRRFAYSGWHGRYRAFEGHRVRVIDGEKERPSRVYAADIFGILGLAPSPLELQKLEARCWCCGLSARYSCRSTTAGPPKPARPTRLRGKPPAAKRAEGISDLTDGRAAVGGLNPTCATL